MAMRIILFPLTAVALLAAANSEALSEVKPVSYPTVRVRLAEAYSPDAAFQKMQIAFAQAIAAKDSKAMLALVGPTFLWMSHGDLNDEFDFGRGATDNFSTVFGFGTPSGGGTANGPLWEILAGFAGDQTFYRATDTLVCGPTSASVVDNDDFNSAKKRMGADETVEWYFTTADAVVVSTPTDAGTPIGHTGQVALPVLSVSPQAKAGEAKPAVTHLQVLLPSGKSGWIPISAAIPLSTDRLCYALTIDGDWKFAAFDQGE
jgi:hypothetical protein